MIALLRRRRRPRPHRATPVSTSEDERAADAREADLEAENDEADEKEARGEEMVSYEVLSLIVATRIAKNKAPVVLLTTKGGKGTDQSRHRSQQTQQWPQGRCSFQNSLTTGHGRSLGLKNQLKFQLTRCWTIGSSQLTHQVPHWAGCGNPCWGASLKQLVLDEAPSAVRWGPQPPPKAKAINANSGNGDRKQQQRHHYRASKQKLLEHDWERARAFSN